MPAWRVVSFSPAVWLRDMAGICGINWTMADKIATILGIEPDEDLWRGLRIAEAAALEEMKAKEQDGRS